MFNGNLEQNPLLGVKENISSIDIYDFIVGM